MKTVRALSKIIFLIFLSRRRYWMKVLLFLIVIINIYHLTKNQRIFSGYKKTNALELHKIDASPPCRAVMMLCEIIGVDVYTIDAVRDDPYPTSPAFLELNPLRSVPVLVDGDLIIHESNVILQYLVDTYGHSDSLYPKDAKQRALVNQKLFFEAGILYPRIEDSTYPAILEGIIRISRKRLKDIEEAYGFLEDFLQKSEYLAGQSMTIADIAAIASVTSLMKIVSLDKFPKTQAWVDEITSQSFCKKHNENGAKLYGMLIKFDDDNNNENNISSVIRKIHQ